MLSQHHPLKHMHFSGKPILQDRRKWGTEDVIGNGSGQPVFKPERNLRQQPQIKSSNTFWKSSSRTLRALLADLVASSVCTSTRKQNLSDQNPWEGTVGEQLLAIMTLGFV